MVGETNFQQEESKLMGVVKHFVEQFDTVAKFNDPKGVYAHCLACEVK